MAIRLVASRVGLLAPLIGLGATTVLVLASITPAHLSWNSWYVLFCCVGVVPSMFLAILNQRDTLVRPHWKCRAGILGVVAIDVLVMVRNTQFLSAIPEVVSGVPVLSVKGSVIRTITWEEYWRWSNAHVAVIAGVSAVFYAACLLARRNVN